MSMESIVQEQERQNQRVALKVAKKAEELLKNIIKEIKNGLDPDLAMRDIYNASKSKLDAEIAHASDAGKLSEADIKTMREMMKPLNEYADLHDGCLKSASFDEITAGLKDYTASPPKISKDQFLRKIKDCVNAPEMLRTGREGSASLESIKKSVLKRANEHGTLLNKETLNISKKKMKRQLKKFAQQMKKAGATLGKGAATAALGASTMGIGAVVQLVKELVTAAKRAIEKTAGVDKDSIRFSRDR